LLIFETIYLLIATDVIPQILGFHWDTLNVSKVMG